MCGVVAYEHMNDKLENYNFLYLGYNTKEITISHTNDDEIWTCEKIISFTLVMTNEK